jgi:hypothetical protein
MTSPTDYHFTVQLLFSDLYAKTVIAANKEVVTPISMGVEGSPVASMSGPTREETTR